jgi:hypothetical protein
LRKKEQCKEFVGNFHQPYTNAVVLNARGRVNEDTLLEKG